MYMVEQDNKISVALLMYIMKTRGKTNTKIVRGFTLIELLVVIVLLGFLSITGLSLFQGSQKRGRDVRRKTDLAQIAKSLEMYANDYGYPASGTGVDNGKIMGCGTTGTACSWGSVWSRTVGSSTVVYMQKLPNMTGDTTYCYQRDASGRWYKLFAKLERTEDPDYDGSGLLPCGGSSVYTYVLMSSNVVPTPTP